jgi:addiction module HigA family antidote
MTARRLPYPRIIDFLRNELMAPFELTQTALSKATGIPLARINQILLAKRAITPDMDLRLVFGNYSLNELVRFNICKISNEIGVLLGCVSHHFFRSGVVDVFSSLSRMPAVSAPITKA